MYRRILAMLMLLLMLPAAIAEEYIPYEVTPFSGFLPEQLREPFAGIAQTESNILSGAIILHNGDKAADEPEHKDACTALMLYQAADGPRLYAAARTEGLPWQINDFTRFLRDTESMSVGIYRPKNTMVPVFSLDYATPEGLLSDLFCFWGNRLWCMNGHINEEQQLTLRNEMGMISVRDSEGHEKFRCRDPYFLDYMPDLSAFPVSHAQAQALSWLPDFAPPAAGTILYCKGANLRAAPTGKSDSLGQYADNVPMIFTGEKQQGANYPWVQVRIGSTVGWMSSNYTDNEPDWGFAPVPLGRTVQTCTLYDAPDCSQAVSQLAPGTTFHILTEINGLYHICIPKGEISCAVDHSGDYGYILAADILTGFSPSALDALENAR